jgi:hypothetical protein
MGTATTARKTFQSSDLSRQSRSVFAAAEIEPVEVTRRDGAALVLMSSAEDEARDYLLQFAAQLIAATLDDRGSLADRLAERFPWMLALNDVDRVTCADDLVRAARASFATGQAHLAMAELASWRSTAEAVAAGLGTSPVEWLDESELVPKP